jgi:Flp pilus assembly protein CpaB
MEMEFKDGSRRRRILLVVGVALALAAGASAFYLSSRATAQAAPVPMRTVIVAAKEIPARTVIQTSHLTRREIPESAALLQAVSDPNVLVGRLTGVTIYANQPVTPNLLATSAAGAEFSVLSPTETISPDSPVWRAVSVTVPKERAVGGQLAVGQRVDLFVTVDFKVQSVDSEGNLSELPGEDGEMSGKATKVTWEDVELLAKDEDGDIYILKVNLHQAEEINHVQASAEGSAFGIALRPDGDSRDVDTTEYGETVDRLIEEYNFPVPHMVDLQEYPQSSPVPGPYRP